MKMDKCESCGTSGCGHCACGCMCHKLIPALVTIYGIIMICSMMVWLPSIITPKVAGLALPIFLIIGGLKAMFANKCKCC